MCFFFFFFNDTATTEIYTLSLHDALPIWEQARCEMDQQLRTAHRGSSICPLFVLAGLESFQPLRIDRKSTRLNSSHGYISYAVFCLKKKKKTTDETCSD